MILDCFSFNLIEDLLICSMILLDKFMIIYFPSSIFWFHPVGCKRELNWTDALNLTMTGLLERMDDLQLWRSSHNSSENYQPGVTLEISWFRMHCLRFLADPLYSCITLDQPLKQRWRFHATAFADRHIFRLFRLLHK